MSTDLQTGLGAFAIEGRQSPAPTEDSIYSVIEDARYAPDDTAPKPVRTERADYVQDLYEGPRTCQCCIDWIESEEIKEEPEPEEDDKNGTPLVVRHSRTYGGKKRFTIHSIEIKHVELRKVLLDVFKGLDGIIPELKYLTLWAPFKQFYWRWDAFEKAIVKTEDATVVKLLKMLRKIVKTELADAFYVSKELMSHGVITDQYLWTLYTPGDLIYQNDDGADRFFVLQSVCKTSRTELCCLCLDYDGTHFGMSERYIYIPGFTGTRKVNELEAYPARFLENLDEVKERVLERGKKFQELAGVHYMSYHESVEIADGPLAKGRKFDVDRRIIIDAASHPSKFPLHRVYEEGHVPLYTNLIKQEPPVSVPPLSGHVPLAPGYNRAFGPPPPMPAAPAFGYPNYVDVMPPPPPPGPGHPRRRPRRAKGPFPPMPRNLSPPRIRDDDEEERGLSDFQLLLAKPTVKGFCLREKSWEEFNISQIREIAFNTAPFDSLVLPEGYKDLILAFVESQLHQGDSFDDVINGKGGGLVILLAGQPGVGKTLTAESVAERIHAPLYKMEIRDTEDSDDMSDKEDIDDFKLAAKWNAVLLIDECDTYLHKRNDYEPKRNKVVASFLHKLEYHPSLLFLTTNRTKSLDTALASRVHLTINYPALDVASRLTIWQNFLITRQKEGDEPCELDEDDFDKLSRVNLNGRRIRNVVKTAQIMAKRGGRGVGIDDIKKVLKITEGLNLDNKDVYYAASSRSSQSSQQYAESDEESEC